MKVAVWKIVATFALLVTLFLVTAARFLQELPGGVETAATLIVTLILGLVAPGLLDWLKNKLGLSGLAAFRFILLVSAVVAGVAMFLGGYFIGFEATAENILAAFGVFLAAVTYVYKALNPKPQT